MVFVVAHLRAPKIHLVFTLLVWKVCHIRFIIMILISQCLCTSQGQLNESILDEIRVHREPVSIVMMIKLTQFSIIIYSRRIRGPPNTYQHSSEE